MEFLAGTAVGPEFVAETVHRSAGPSGRRRTGRRPSYAGYGSATRVPGM